MPKYGIHHHVLSEATRNLLESRNADIRAAAAQLVRERGIGRLGAIGPDLFFWAPDSAEVDKLYRFYSNMKEVVSLYDQVMEPIRQVGDAVGEPVEAALETLGDDTVELVRQLVERARDTAALFRTTLATGLFAGVVDGFDVMTEAARMPSVSELFFNQFRPGAQLNRPEREWSWFDTLHYRRTGAYARSLVELATSPRQKAYAYGYLSHVATDVLGHAYVNQVVGAPYRLNVQRHVTVENFMDTWAFDHHYGQSANASLLRALELPEPSRLPTEVVDLIVNAMRRTYAGTQPRRLGGDGFPTQRHVRQSFESLHEVLSVMERMYVKHPTEPFSGVLDVLAHALDDLLEPPPSPPSSPSESCGWGDILSFGLTESSSDCYEGFMDELSGWMGYLGELMQWLAETALDLIDLILATLAAIPITVLLAILYGTQLLLFSLYQSCRSTLALHGFSLPEPDDLHSSHGAHLIAPTLSCGTAFKFPRLKGPSQSHLVCPSLAVEDPGTAADPFEPTTAVSPEDFISGAPMDFRALVAYAQAPTPEATRALQLAGARIGNAVGLTEWMIGTAANGGAPAGARDLAFTDWNLDADRGYGYKTWKGTVNAPTATAPPSVDPERYT
ncbi:MAG: zinc dependent phospholipase C family protein [Gemmatimonadota bacterium]|nr:zinc dependent phospholipase C family protein [Gemmatimonadota bacterium]MDH5759060.1 zinc dependent phospholipase C family protein [Gemmatimonadota bacterium]